ncbi:MAG: hypothetical protein WA734_07940, partial [Candidatus Acidiferrales bacterium]
LTAVHAARERALKGLAEPEALPAAVDGFEPVKKRRQEIAGEVLDYAQRTARHISETLRLKISGSISDQIHEYELTSFERLEANMAATTEPISFKLPQMDISATMPVVPSKLLTKWATFRETKVGSLREAAARLRKIMEDANVLVQAGSPFAECEKVVQTAQNSLTADLTLFFGSAELYRAGVFTHTTKESIGALGLGKELDALEVEFDETDRAKFTADAISDLFPKFAETANDARTQVAAMEKKLRPLVTRVHDLKIPTPDTNYTLLDGLVATESHSMVQDLFRELRDNVGLFIGSLEAKLSGIFVERRRAYEKEISAAQKRRRFLYGGAFVVGVLLGVCTFYAYAYSVEIPQNDFHAVLWNIVAQLIWAPLSFVAAKTIDNFPKRSATIRREHQAILRSSLENAALKEATSYEFAAISVPALTLRLDRTYQTVIDYDPDSWSMTAGERLTVLRDLQSEFGKTHAECVDLVETVTDKVSSYFSDATKNLQLLNDAADKIKARAIEPSFKLLGDTRESLHQIKQLVHEVEFG